MSVNLKIIVTKPSSGQALIKCIENGVEVAIFLEKDRSKANALTDSLEAVGKLGIEYGPGA